MQDFCSRINMLKGNCFKNNPAMNYVLSKSAEIVHSKSIFYVKNQQNLFKKKTFKNINLGDRFLYNSSFSNFNF